MPHPGASHNPEVSDLSPLDIPRTSHLHIKHLICENPLTKSAKIQKPICENLRNLRNLREPFCVKCGGRHEGRAAAQLRGIRCTPWNRGPMSGGVRVLREIRGSLSPANQRNPQIIGIPNNQSAKICVSAESARAFLCQARGADVGVAQRPQSVESVGIREIEAPRQAGFVFSVKSVGAFPLQISVIPK